MKLMSKASVAALLVALTTAILGDLGSAAAESIVATRSEPIVVEVNRGTVVRLAASASHVFVANPEVADVQVKSERLLYIFGKKAGQTTVYAVGPDDTVLMRRDIDVTHNLGSLSQAIEQIVPNGVVAVESVEGTIVLTGQVATAAEAETIRALTANMVEEREHVINQINITGPNQVSLRVKIVEMRRDVGKKLGINFNNALRLRDVGSDVAFGLFTPDIGNLVDNIPVNQANLFVNNAATDIDLIFDLLDRENLVSVLAEPNLTAISGETASFLVGGEFPIPISQREDRITIVFKEFGIKLAFTPTMVSRNRISLNVRPEVSRLSDEGAIELANIRVPALATRRAETTVELGSGQSFAIAGLLSNDTQNEIKKYPGLGDLPVLGALFRSNQFIRNETELVIIVTPLIVQPVRQQMATPMDGYTVPNDVERYWEGRRYRQGMPIPSGGPATRSSGGIVGQAGYTLF